MRWSAAVGIVVVIAIIAIWTSFFKVSDKHPEMMPSLAGCYLSKDTDRSQRVDVTASGGLKYRDISTPVVPYEDKQSLSLLPDAKVVVGSNGDLEFQSGNPLLLRFSEDRLSFTVPSETGPALAFRKGAC